MTTALQALPADRLPALPVPRVPAPISTAGDQAAERFIEFFNANIRNPIMPAAYVRAAKDFFGWCGRHCLAALLPQLQLLMRWTAPTTGIVMCHIAVAVV